MVELNAGGVGQPIVHLAFCARVGGRSEVGSFPFFSSIRLTGKGRVKLTMASPRVEP